MIRPGHIPKLESHFAKALQSIQKFPDEEREKMLGFLVPMRALLNEQSAFNKRLSDSILTVETDIVSTPESWMRHFMLMGG